MIMQKSVNSKNKLFNSINILALLTIISVSFVIFILVLEITRKKDNIYQSDKQYAFFDGFKYATSYLYKNKYVRNDTIITIHFDKIFDACNTKKDSLTYEQYFFDGFNYALINFYINKYLNDSNIKINMDTIVYNCNKQRINYYKSKGQKK